MGELISRSASEPGTWRTRTRVMLFAAVALLLPATMVATAAAQDEPPKVEAPKAAPPPPPDLPGGLETAPQDVQKKDSAPDEKKKDEKKKDAPTAPDGKEKAAQTAPADTEKPAPSAPDEASKNAAPPAPAFDQKAALDLVEALSTRFKFDERYSVVEDSRRPQLLTQYRVGMVETTKYEFERAQGAPERTQRSRTLVYAERAAKVGKLGEPIDLVRRYDKVILRDLVQPRPVNPPLLQGLTVWYHIRPPLRPQVISLTPDRSLSEDEFAMIEQEVSISSLTAFFPTSPKRKSETWSIPSSAIEIVSGRAPDPDGFELTGTLEQVGRSENGNHCVAEIGVTGRFDVEGEPSAFRARIEFVFFPRSMGIPQAGAAVAGASMVVMVHGSIKRALMSFVRMRALPEGDGRFKQRFTTELTMERRPMVISPGERATAPEPLALPAAAPIPTQANSWVVFDGPDGRFHFWHPQEFVSVPQRAPTRTEFEYLDRRPREGNAFLQILLPARGINDTSQQQFRDPAGLQKTLEAAWLKDKAEVTRGPKGWLDDPAWKDSKRRVYRIEAALKSEAGMKPVYADYYFVEFNETQRFVVLSYTERTDHLAVRNDAEAVIRSFQWGPSKRVAAPPAAATSAPASGDAPGAAPVLPSTGLAPSAANPPAAPAAPPQ